MACPATYHCEDCQVCVDGHDHHCVFFSKCIGKGNLYFFYGAVVLCISNFAFMIVMTILKHFSYR